jgi:trans-aconitate methyltransferase
VTSHEPPAIDDWDAHWRDYASAAEANPAQRYRHELIARILGEAPGSPARILDLGSGQGDFLVRAARLFPDAQLAGIELSTFGIEVSQAKVPGARFFSVDVTDAPAIPQELVGWATHVVCSEVLEHVDDDTGLMRAARVLMAPGCRVVVTVPGGRMSAFDRHIGHRRHYDPTTITAVLRNAGLRVERAQGAGFPAFNLYRAMVIARGQRLAADATVEGSGAAVGRVTRAAMVAMRPLFRLNRDSSRFGLQIVAVASVPPE